jgi:3-oxoacyl-[acyl-carrier-protein] synthase II
MEGMMEWKERPNEQRVVITGMGAITPLGLNVESYWDSLTKGISGIEFVSAFDATDYPCVVAGEIKGFDPKLYIEPKQVRRMSRFTQLAVAATEEAILSSQLKLDNEDREKIGVILGNGIGGFPDTEDQVKILAQRGWSKVSPLYMSKMLPNMAAGNVAMRYGLEGYNSTAVTACAAATQAIGDAVNVIKSGRAHTMITGGSEGAISAMGLAAFSAMRALSQRKDDPHGASRPFDSDRDGFVPAEAAGIFVIESLTHALNRKAPILAEIIGSASTSDAYDFVAPREDGSGAARTMNLAIKDAGIQSENIDYINAHGTSTPIGDLAETTAIKRVFGETTQIPVSSTKSMTGHPLGASGAIEAIACVQTIRSGIIHPTINLDNPDPNCNLDYVPNVARKAEVKIALSNSFGFGGQNACVIISQYED